MKVFDQIVIEGKSPRNGQRLFKSVVSNVTYVSDENGAHQVGTCVVPEGVTMKVERLHHNVWFLPTN